MALGDPPHRRTHTTRARFTGRVPLTVTRAINQLSFNAIRFGGNRLITVDVLRRGAATSTHSWRQ
jgi:hypothetical protein